MVSLFIGRRKSGKTHRLLDSLTEAYRFYYDAIVIFSPTFLLDPEWRRLKKTRHLYVYLHYRDDVVGLIIDWNSKRKKPWRILIVADDCVNEEALYQSPNMQRVACNGRHLQISLMISAQKLTTIDTTVRTNFDQILFFYSSSRREIQNLRQDVDISDELIDYCTREKFSYLNAMNEGGRLQIWHSDKQRVQ